MKSRNSKAQVTMRVDGKIVTKHVEFKGGSWVTKDGQRLTFNDFLTFEEHKR